MKTAEQEAVERVVRDAGFVRVGRTDPALAAQYERRVAGGTARVVVSSRWVTGHIFTRPGYTRDIFADHGVSVADPDAVRAALAGLS